MSNILIIIDLQNDFCNGVFKNDAVQRTIPNLCKFIKSHEKHYSRIILTQDTHTEETYKSNPESEQFPIHCIKDSFGWKIIKQLWHCLHESRSFGPIVNFKKVTDKLEFVEKDKFAIDEREWMKILMKTSSIGSIDIIGTATEYCVYENYKIISKIYTGSKTTVSVIPEFCIGLDFDKSNEALKQMNKNYIYSASKLYNKIIEHTKKLFETEFKGLKAVVGVSGGKDSSVVLTLLVEALGKENVIPVTIPNGAQKDISDSYEICKFNGFEDDEIININIYSVMNALKSEIELSRNLKSGNVDECPRYKTNTPARARMTVLYSIAALKNGVVANTCNLSEDYVGYSTKFGDSAGDFALINHLTVNEVVRLGEYMNIPDKLIHKIPDDGMCGKSDEDNLGFSYDILDAYIRRECIIPEEIKNKIIKMHDSNITKSKLCLIPKNMSFKPKLY